MSETVDESPNYHKVTPRDRGQQDRTAAPNSPEKAPTRGRAPRAREATVAASTAVLSSATHRVAAAGERPGLWRDGAEPASSVLARAQASAEAARGEGLSKAARVGHVAWSLWLALWAVIDAALAGLVYVGTHKGTAVALAAVAVLALVAQVTGAGAP